MSDDKRSAPDTERVGYMRRCCCGNFMNWRRLYRGFRLGRGNVETWMCCNCGRTYEEKEPRS